MRVIIKDENYYILAKDELILIDRSTGEDNAAEYINSHTNLEDFDYYAYE